MKDVQKAREEIEGYVEYIMKEYTLDYSDLAWILLSLGLNYYLMDMTDKKLSEE